MLQQSYLKERATIIALDKIERVQKKLAVILSQITAKYHLQTAITPFAIIMYFTWTSASIAISWYFVYVKIRK